MTKSNEVKIGQPQRPHDFGKIQERNNQPKTMCRKINGFRDRLVRLEFSLSLWWAM